MRRGGMVRIMCSCEVQCMSPEAYGGLWGACKVTIKWVNSCAPWIRVLTHRRLSKVSPRHACHEACISLLPLDDHHHAIDQRTTQARDATANGEERVGRQWRQAWQAVARQGRNQHSITKLDCKDNKPKHNREGQQASDGQNGPTRQRGQAKVQQANATARRRCTRE